MTQGPSPEFLNAQAEFGRRFALWFAEKHGLLSKGMVYSPEEGYHYRILDHYDENPGYFLGVRVNRDGSPAWPQNSPEEPECLVSDPKVLFHKPTADWAKAGGGALAAQLMANQQELVGQFVQDHPEVAPIVEILARGM